MNSKDRPEMEAGATSRRGFLKLAAASAPAVAVAASGSAAAASDVEATTEGLRETAHVLAYYESAKF